MTVYDFAKKCMADPEFNRGGIVKNERKYLDAVGFQGADMHEFYDAMMTLLRLNNKYAK